MSDGTQRPPGGPPAMAPPGYGPPQAASPQMGYGPPPQPQMGYGPPPQQPGYGPPPQPQMGYGPPPQQMGYGPPYNPSPMPGPPMAGPAMMAPPAAPQGYGAYAQPAGSWAAEPGAAGAYGDAAGEHLQMKRGRFSAWAYVVLAFIGEMIVVGLIPGAVLGYVVELMGAPDPAAGLVMFGATLVLGGPLSYLVFRDRWRCIEAFSSRFCVGLMNISILFVPAIALVYANVRGFQKFAGK